MFVPRRRHALPFSLGLLFSPIVALAPAQQAAQPPASTPPAAADAQLSPQAAYQDALRPLEATRHNIANWSDVEIAAMNVAIANAKAACTARHAQEYTGSALVDLARLCALGQQWPDVIDAAGKYIIASDSAKPLLTDAYTAMTEAHLHLKQEPEALQTALELLKAVPYSSEASQCITEAVEYMRFVHLDDALKLAAARQPLVLAALQATTSQAGAGAPEPDSPSISQLYADGLSLATLQQLASKPADAQATLGVLDAALPPNAPTDDRIRIDQQRHQYDLLGKPLTGLKLLTSLSSPSNHLPKIPATNTITALLLFPDWCASCVRLGPQFPETVFQVEGHSAYLYALLAETVPPRKPDPTITNAAFNPAYAAGLLAETPSVTVAPETLTRFDSGGNYPLLLITDSRGFLRVIQPVSAQDLQPGGDVDAAIALIGRNFSQPIPPGAKAGATPARSQSHAAEQKPVRF